MNKLCLFCVFVAVVLLSACSDNVKTYKIGVSQCASGNWREKVNSEMLSAQHLYDTDVEVSIACAYDDTERQILQIDSLVNQHVDLLVVAPNESAPLTAAIANAYSKGIPVICFDRKAETNDYTAFIGGNNVDAGKTVAQYALELAKGINGKKPSVLEITATMGTSPARERHLGFSGVMTNHPEVIYQCIYSDWSDTEAYNLLKDKIKKGNVPDIVFCHSDYMGRGCYKALKEAHMEKQVKVLGVDGLPGEGEGIEAVQKGSLAGTYIYPTHGEEVVRLALNILTNQPFEHDNFIPGTMVTPENADILALNSNELLNQGRSLVAVQDKLEEKYSLVNSLNRLIAVFICAIVLLVIALLLYMRAVKKTKKANLKMKELNEEQSTFYTNASHQLRTPLTLIAGPVKKLLEQKTLGESNMDLLQIINRNVAQLEVLISDVLNFKDKMTGGVNDNTASEAIVKANSDESVKKGRLSMLKQEDSDELSDILIVDDNEDMRRYLRTLLADRYYVLEASDGQSGLKLARECVPDLVVSDVMMPIMDGLQFCKCLKEDVITSHIPVLLLTARSSEAHKMEGYESGADAYLTKPFNADVLISRINNLLKNRQRLRLLADEKQPEEGAKEKLSTPDKLFIDNLKEAIKKNMANPNLRMDDLGDEIGLSRVQMYRKVKVLTGLSPTELLRQMRLQKAYVLLNSTSKTVAEIAFEVGFNTPGYFSKCFREQYGKQPTDLRAD